MLPPEVGILQLVSVQGSGDVDVFSTDAHHFPLQLCKLDSTRYILGILGSLSKIISACFELPIIRIIPSSIQSLNITKCAGKAAKKPVAWGIFERFELFLQTCLLLIFWVTWWTRRYPALGSHADHSTTPWPGQRPDLEVEVEGWDRAKFMQVNTTCCRGQW